MKFAAVTKIIALPAILAIAQFALRNITVIIIYSYFPKY